MEKCAGDFRWLFRRSNMGRHEGPTLVVHKAIIETGTKQTPSERFDVLINSYMRSGSTITGHVLGHRDDVFYFYEPLRPFQRMSYFKGQDTVCKYLTPSCRNQRTQVVKGALDFLKAIYNCSFDQSSAMRRTIGKVGTNMYLKSGASWEVFLDCMSYAKSYNACIPTLVPKCREAKHRVAKVLRLTLDNVEELLQEIPRLKVVHLLRDPRGIINSHIKTKWFPFRDDSQERVRRNAETQCSRMMHDTEAGKQLIQRFPDRAKIIHYEDFNDTVELAKYLYDFFGMEFSEKYRLLANTSDSISATKSTDGYHPFTFRKSLSWETVQTIDSVCKPLYKELGYRSFVTEQEFRNNTLSIIEGKLTFSHLA